MIKYYDNKEEHGKIYDWDLIRKRYRKLKVPKDIYDPTTAPIELASYLSLMSIRSTGKTTNWLLVGMILNDEYGVQTGYIRQTEDMTAPVNARELLSVIREYKNGHYIKEITHGKWSSCEIKSRRIYYCNRDENGKVTEIAEEPWLIELSLDRMELYKSSLNVPNMDLILFDEFISSRYVLNEFVTLMQLLSTIIRSRKSPKVVLLANNTNVNSPYFKEFEISKEVKALQTGDHLLTKTGLGTPIYIELIGMKPSRIRAEVNSLYFGFSNPQLSSITGADSWSFETVPHIINNDDDRVLYKGLRIECANTLLQAEILYTSDRGLIANVHECTKIYKDSIILTQAEIYDQQHIFGFGEHIPICNLLWKLFKQNKIYYDNNESGALLKDYIKQMKMRRI